ncbi:hypothetical protein Bca52824_007302 [Brassica carinata]|uniref:Alpha/beta hydrolase fold-3 domain-containing protein n=1 Tax=Brassica carinata TaxID=52824 RepID=A0A8X7W7M5_BRACI|nr:hypothetical protein Bca52824_007302 [Brassica carinata]
MWGLLSNFNRHLAEFLDRKVPQLFPPRRRLLLRPPRLLLLHQPPHQNLPPSSPRPLPLRHRRPHGASQHHRDRPRSRLFHGGSFTHSSANSAIYDTFCRRLVTICGVVVVSVDYRRSPEHRYPCAYDDGWNALRWVKSRIWLRSGKHSDVYVYLAGDSSGGNIAHNVAVRATSEGVKVLGNILLHPMFGGLERTLSEKRLDGKYFVTVQDRDWYWRAFLPQGEDRDHPAYLVQDWQLAYVDGLKKTGQDVNLLYLEQATIGFYFLPNNDHFRCLMDELKKFVHSMEDDSLSKASPILLTP